MTTDHKERVKNVVGQRNKHDRSADRMLDSDNNLKPANQRDVDEAWNDSKAMRFRDDARDRMKAGTQDKLDEAAKRKLAEQSRARQDQIDKEKAAKDQMVRKE